MRLDFAILLPLLAAAHTVLAQPIEPPTEGTSLSPRSAAPVSVADLIELTRFGSGVGAERFTDQDQMTWSPDGSRVAVVTNKGKLGGNTIEYTLSLLEVADFYRNPRMTPVAAFASSSNEPGISFVRWLDQNTTVAFLAEHPGKLPQVYTLDTRNGQLIQRTRATRRIIDWDISMDAQAVVYLCDRDADTTDHDQLRSRGFVLRPGARLWHLLEGPASWKYVLNDGPTDIHGSSGSRTSPLQELRLARRNGVNDESLDQAIGKTPLVELHPRYFALSPSGDAVLVRGRPPGLPDQTLKLGTGAILPVKHYGQWLAVDLKKMTSRLLPGVVLNSSPSLLSVPARKGSITWSIDAQSVFLSDVINTLTQKKAQRSIVELDLAEDDLSIVASLPDGPWVREMTWDSRQGLLKVTLSGGGGGALYYRRGKEQWDRAESPAQDGPGLLVEEGLNLPWRLVAVDPKTQARTVIYDANPELLRDRRFGRVTKLGWNLKGSSKHDEATLYWPPEYKAGQTYPLVIQGHGRSFVHFRPEGNTPACHAAQPLANVGMFVVQMSEGLPDWNQGDYTTYDGVLYAQLEGLIDRLADGGLVDRNRVALSGFSTDHAAFLHFMTHTRYSIAAATLGEGVEYSYFSYLAVGPMAQSGLFPVNSKLPWGDGRQLWLERAPGFNMDRVTAAVQFHAAGDPLVQVLNMWEAYQALEKLGRPTEMIFQPNALHGRVRPWDRFVSQQAALDWLRFWLQGYERTEPITRAGETVGELKEKYGRWRAMRNRKDSASPATN